MCQGGMGHGHTMGHIQTILNPLHEVSKGEVDLPSGKLTIIPFGGVRGRATALPLRFLLIRMVLMAEDYRNSREWQALNRIWKAVPAFARDNVKDDFRIITEMIKMPAAAAPVQEEKKPAPAPAPAAPVAVGATNFLAGLSADARKLALSLLTKEGFNLYDYLVELAAKSRATDAEELFDAYVSQRDIDDDQEEALMEIIRACLKRARA